MNWTQAAMKIITDPIEMQRAALAIRRNGRTIALVPTMGCLHAGHISLVRVALRRADRVIVSLFVNPAQFGPNEDFEAYPRNLERDLGLLEAEGVDLAFCPSPEHLYAPDHSTFVNESKVSQDLCGASRPGHFRGVCTIVLKLFNLVTPDRAYFGEKDFQQLLVIRRMIRDLDVPVEVRGCPIVREKDGLALSSRNVYLAPGERESALALSRSLREAKQRYEQGETRASVLVEGVKALLGRDPALKVDYVELRDAEDLSAIVSVDRPAVLALAVRVGKTRLIDNTVLGGVRL